MMEAIQSPTYDDFNDRISSFPCLVNQKAKRMRDKIRGIKIKLENELKVDNDSHEEMIEKLNFYTWIDFELSNYPKANEHNQKAFDLTSGKNITCLVNRAHILRREGVCMESEQCLAEAEKLRRESDGEKLMTEVDAELAYSLSRLSGAENLNRAIELYTDVVKKQPECYAWKFGLGLLHRRATNRNVFSYMSSKKPNIEHAEKALELLSNVAEKSSDFNLRGRAYAQLAVMKSQSDRCFSDADCNLLFGEPKFHNLIENALKYGSKDAWTLSECGRILRYTELENAISLLEKSLSIKRHSTTLHHLGLCYELKAKQRAKYEAKRWQQRYGATLKATIKQKSLRFQSEIPESTEMRCDVKKINYNREDPCVLRAIDYYKQAIDMLYVNSPARFSLGLLLKKCENYDDALRQFDQILHLNSRKDGTSSKQSGDQQEYLYTVTDSYEQAGLCLLELARQPGKSEEEKTKLKEAADKRLLKAVSFAATLSRLESEGKRCNKQAWNAFKTLETKYQSEEIEENSPQATKKYIDLLYRMSRFEKILEVIGSLKTKSDGNLADPRVIRSGLESYLALKQYEAAYVFLLTYETSPHFGDCPAQLDGIILKVHLCFVATLDFSDKLHLKIWFDSYIAENNKLDNDVLDVLIVYDECGEPADEVEEVVNKLQQIISGDFGLGVDNIREAVSNSGRTLLNDLQLQEIAKARVVLVLLRETQSSLFTSLCEFIPTIKINSRENGSPEPNVLLGLLDDRVKIPPVLKNYNQIALRDLMERIQVSSEEQEDVEDPKNMHPDTRGLEASGACHHDVSGVPEATNVYPSDCLVDTVSQSSSGEFNDCVIAKMSLYCWLINKECPL